MYDTTLSRLHHHRETRLVAKAPMTTAEVPLCVEGAPGGGLLPPPGSIVLYVGRTASPAWQAVRRRILDGDWSALAATAVRRARPFEPLRVETLEDADVCFDVRHAGRTLMANAALPAELAYGTLTFPFTGGDVDDADFDVVEYLKTPDDARALSYSMLRRAPELTVLEAEMLGKLPPELRELHVGPRLPCGNITSMDDITNDIARAAQAAVDAKHRGGAVADTGRMRLTDDVVAQIAGRDGGPAASVGELLALRRRLLGR